MRAVKRAAVVFVALLATAPASAGRQALGVVIAGTKGKIRAKDGIRLGADVSWQGPRASFRYDWTSIGDSAIPGAVDAASEKLVIPAAELAPGDHYRIRVRVIADWVGKDDDGDDSPQQTEATSEVEVEVNAAPAGGRCTMAVEWVGKAGARLSLAAPDWNDDDRIQYRWELVKNGKKTLLENWITRSSYQANVALRPGETLQARCVVRDDLGDQSSADSELVTRP
jgi:hypothetical protein